MNTYYMTKKDVKELLGITSSPFSQTKITRRWKDIVKVVITPLPKRDPVFSSRRRIYYKVETLKAGEVHHA